MSAEPRLAEPSAGRGGGLRARWLALSPNLRGAVWMVGAALGFTVNGALVKALGAMGLPTMQIAFARAFFTLLVVLPFLWHAGLGALATTAPGLHLIRALAGAGAMVCGFYAFVLLPLADVTALTFTTPLFTIVLAVLLLGERVRWRRWTATAIGFLGVLIMVRPGAGSLEPGALLAIAMAFGIAVATVMVKRLPAGESHAAMLFWFCVASLLMTAVPAALVWQAPSPTEWLLMVSIGALGGGAQALIIRAFSTGEATFVAPFDYSKLLLAVAIGLVFFSELPDLWSLLGAAVILGSNLYIARRDAALERIGTRRKHSVLPPSRVNPL